jgi:hypothetical protein
MMRPESLKGRVFTIAALVKIALYLPPGSIQSCTACWFLTMSPKSRKFFFIIFAIFEASSFLYNFIYIIIILITCLLVRSDKINQLVGLKRLPKMSSLKFNKHVLPNSTSLIEAAWKQESHNWKKARSRAPKTLAENSLSTLKHTS